MGASGRSRGRLLATLEGRLPGLVQVRAFREAYGASPHGPLAKNYTPTLLGFTCIQVEATLRAYSKRRNRAWASRSRRQRPTESVLVDGERARVLVVPESRAAVAKLLGIGEDSDTA